MKYYKVLIIIVSLIVVFILALVLLDKFSVSKKTRNECHPISGGSFNLTFITNSAIEIEDMHICIACPPDSYEDLPVLTREGYSFEGWYYDKQLTNKVTVTNTKDIPPKAKFRPTKCIVGYKDIVLYAKWDKQ